MNNLSRQLITSSIAISFLIGSSSSQAGATEFVYSPNQSSFDRLNRQLNNEPDHIATLKQRAALASVQEKHDESIADLDRILTLEPKNLWALDTRANEFLALKKYDQALADANNLVQATTRGYRSAYLLRRAALLYALSHDKEAAQDLTDVLDRCPEVTRTEKLLAYSNRAELYCRLGKFDKALEDCAKTIEIDPRGCGGAAFYWRGQALKALKDDAGAAAANTRSKELGYVDTGREIISTSPAVYESMSDSVQKQFGQGVQKQFSHRIDTRHFVFFFNADEPAVNNMARFSECFLMHLNKDLLETKWDAPVNVFVTADKVSQDALLKQLNTGSDMPDWMGNCVPQRNAMVFSTQNGIGTVAANIFRHVGLRTFESFELHRGIDSFFEMIYGYQERDGDSAIYWGYQDPNGLKVLLSSPPGSLKSTQPTLALADVIKLSKDMQSDHQSEERLVAMFLFETNDFKKYVELALSGNHKGYATLLEAVFDKPLPEIEPQWQQYLRGISKDGATLKEIPKSQFFSSKKEFEQFVKGNTAAFKDEDRHLSSNLGKAATASTPNQDQENQSK